MSDIQDYIIYNKRRIAIALYRAESPELALAPYPQGFTVRPANSFTPGELARQLLTAVSCPHCKSPHHAIKDAHSVSKQYRVNCKSCGRQYQPTRLFRGLYPDGMNKSQRHYQKNKAAYTEKQRQRRLEKRLKGEK